jgi:hypothetical protein
MSEERWHEKPLAWQLGNIGSEIVRAINREEKGDIAGRRSAIERALELLDFTLSDKSNIGRIKEVARLREVLASIYVDSKYYAVDLAAIQNYLLPFAILVRR